MRTAGVVMLLVFAAVSLRALDDSQIILDAQTDAGVDGKSHSGFGWGAAAFGASVLLSPLLGGGAVIIMAYTTGHGELPTSRVVAIQSKYNGDANAILLYKTQYEESLTKIERRKNGGAAWAGAGIGLAVLVIVAVTTFY
jgi:hypothetical protein